MKGPIRVNKGHPGSELLKWFKLGVIQKMDVYVSRAGHFSYPRVPLRFMCSFGSYAIGSHVA